MICSFFWIFLVSLLVPPSSFAWVHQRGRTTSIGICKLHETGEPPILPLSLHSNACKDSAETSSPIPPPPAISLPVWSLATPMKRELASSYESEVLPTSMNIVTYAMPVSVAPPKLWAVSLYHGTCTKDSFLEHGHGILQLLRPQHKLLVPVLGKKSSHDLAYSKRAESSLLGFEWIGHPDNDQEFHSMQLLPDCALYVDLQVLPASRSVDAGDHMVVLCQLRGTYEWDGEKIVPSQSTIPLDHTNALYSGLLRQEGII